MRHLGDITKINGAEIAPVDVITYGAPCQDLSVAGKRAGMTSELMGDEATTRSGLFFDALRIIKEMRRADEERNGRSGELVRPAGDSPWVRPRYTIYENVPGALSSHEGRDWQAVLTESIRVIEPEAPPVPLPTGGWPSEGMVYGDGWSAAYCLHDAQHFGIPQRRKRLSLVMDYEGYTAGKVLSDIHLGEQCRSEVQSVSQSLPWDSEQGGTERQGTSGDSEESPFAAGL